MAVGSTGSCDRYPIGCDSYHFADAIIYETDFFDFAEQEMTTIPNPSLELTPVALACIRFGLPGDPAERDSLRRDSVFVRRLRAP